MKFKLQELVAALELATLDDGTVLKLYLTGEMFDGTPVVGEDVVIIRNNDNGKAAGMTPADDEENLVHLPIVVRQ